jgi:phenylpyruvate tautomerase PptA (4-oxalocrotonate tautomerase family)
MPHYTIATQAGTRGAADKIGLAATLTETHCQISGVPENWVHVVFQDYPAGSGFTAGKPAAAVALTLVVRTGRSAEYKRDLLQRLWQLLQDATGASDDQIVIGLNEVPPSQAMEMGRIMPDVGEE